MKPSAETNTHTATTKPPPAKVAYRNLADKLRRELHEGEYANGRQLPTESELSAEHDLSRQTVRRALQELVAEGLIFRIRGRGTFAMDAGPSDGQYLRSIGSVNDLLALSEDTELQTVKPLERRADVQAAGRLRLDRDEVCSATLRRLHEDLPFCITYVHLPVDVGTEIMRSGALTVPGELRRTTVIELIQKTTDEPIASANQSINAAVASDEVAPQIDCAPGQPVLRVDRLYFNATGQPVELAISYFNPDRYSYRLALRRRID